MYRILIVEDDFDILELLQSWLTEAGYQTAEAEDGLKALEVFESGQFDLVLLDLMLPRLTSVFMTCCACLPYSARSTL